MNPYRPAKRILQFSSSRNLAIATALFAGCVSAACASPTPKPTASAEEPSSEVEPYLEGTTSEVSSCSECAKIGFDCVRGYGLEHPSKLYCAPPSRENQDPNQH